MLSIQTERIERGHSLVSSATEHFPVDGIERLLLLISRLAFWRDHSFKLEELYFYYRTLNKLIGKWRISLIKAMSRLIKTESKAQGI